MRPVIYYRRSLMDKSELESASKYFKCVSLLTDIPKNSFVIPRYSMYPFFLDQVKEIESTGSTIINSYKQHRYIADLQNYYYDIQAYTPKTWFRLEDIPEDGPFVLKGETNSKKNYWNKLMFANNKKEASEVHSRLLEDLMLCDQNIYIRKYVPLVTYCTGIGGVPISKEFRFFILDGKVLTGGYYWSNYSEDLPEIPSVDDVPKEFLQKVMDCIGDNCRFYVIDVAQTVSGEYIVIELNDGMQSGLSSNNPDVLYSELKREICPM
jgi:hypothetical protein